MIEILPMQDREREREILKGIKGAGPQARVLAMCERGQTAEDYDFSEAPRGETVFLLDSLMRSAASYGENFGAVSIETAFPDFFGFFRARGFDCDDTHAFTPMSTIVKYEFH